MATLIDRTTPTRTCTPLANTIQVWTPISRLSLPSMCLDTTRPRKPKHRCLCKRDGTSALSHTTRRAISNASEIKRQRMKLSKMQIRRISLPSGLLIIRTGSLFRELPKSMDNSLRRERQDSIRRFRMKGRTICTSRLLLETWMLLIQETSWSWTPIRRQELIKRVTCTNWIKVQTFCPWTEAFWVTISQATSNRARSTSTNRTRR